MNVPDIQAFGKTVEQAWNAGRAELDEREKQVQALSRGCDLLPLYRYI